jgi:hypothetical protein
LKHQFTLMRLHSAIPQKTVIFILATVKTWNPITEHRLRGRIHVIMMKTEVMVKN